MTKAELKRRVMKVQIQLQIPCGSFKVPSITLTRGGDTILIELTKKQLRDIQLLFSEIPTEG